MKKILCFTMLLFAVGVFCGCSTEKNIENYDTAYNAKADFSIKIGESLESVENKIKDLSHEKIEHENGFAYEFREDDNMRFEIYFENDAVKTFGFAPYYEDEEAAVGDCDWFFKGNISAQTTKKEMDASFGVPTLEFSSEDSSEGRYQCEYAFTDDFSLLTKDKYEKSGKAVSAYQGKAYFYDNKLQYFFLGKTGDAADWESVRNTEKDISISLGETEESLKERLSEEEYTMSESFMDSESRQSTRYELRDGDNMILVIDFLDGILSGIMMYPSLWYDMKVDSLSTQETIDAALNAKCDWYFKDDITA
ncbi:MAG: hypothetical protein Q4C00_08085, partial [Bacillota bacterium]|nr:hypothetical protein [Bacillota bacterium]